MLPGEHEELQAGTAGFCSGSPQASQARRRKNHDAHRLSAHFRVRCSAADIITRHGAMWQMIIGFFYRKTNLENNHNLLLSSKIGPVLANNFPPQLLKNLFSVSEAPALIIKVQYLALMRQPVQQSCCEDSVAKKLRPAIKAFI